MEYLEWERQEGHVSHVAEYIKWYDWSHAGIGNFRGSMGHTQKAVQHQDQGQEDTLKNELNNMKKNNLSVNDYVLKIKEVSDALDLLVHPQKMTT